jgi:succinate dehydrogenase / fumarate reductase flavoprotein subunit
MQGLADGYFILPTTVSDYLARHKPIKADQYQAQASAAIEEAQSRITRLMNAPDASVTADDFHRQLGQILWDACGMAREKHSLLAAIDKIKALRDEFWQKVKITGEAEQLNQTLERAGRVADFFELAELMCLDALDREESCGCHAREEHLTDDGEARRNDMDYSYVAAWQYSGDTSQPVLFREYLHFDFVRPSIRNYQ